MDAQAKHHQALGAIRLNPKMNCCFADAKGATPGNTNEDELHSISNCDADESGLDGEETQTYVYRDFSHVKDESIDFPFLQGGSKNDDPFQSHLPVKLNKMLSDPDLSMIITWLPHGRSWLILDRKLFAEEALPRYYDHSNVNSFLRLVNAWGFRRVKNGIDRNSYFHELFLRGMPHLHARMRRIARDEMKTPILSEDQSPKFYDMPQLPYESTSNEKSNEISTAPASQHCSNTSGSADSACTNSVCNVHSIALTRAPDESSPMNHQADPTKGVPPKALQNSSSQNIQQNAAAQHQMYQNHPVPVSNVGPLYAIHPTAMQIPQQHAVLQPIPPSLALPPNNQIAYAGIQNQVMGVHRPNVLFSNTIPRFTQAPIVIIHPQPQLVFQQIPTTAIAAPPIPQAMPLSTNNNPMQNSQALNAPISTAAENSQSPSVATACPSIPPNEQLNTDNNTNLPMSQPSSSQSVSSTIGRLTSILKSSVELPGQEKNGQMIDLLTAFLIIQCQSPVDALDGDQVNGTLDTALQVLRSAERKNASSP